MAGKGTLIPARLRAARICRTCFRQLYVRNNGNWPATWSSFSAGASDFVHGTNMLVATMLASDYSYEDLRLEGQIDVTGHVVVSRPHGAPATPLPSTLSLFATGLGLLGLLGWRRKRRAPAIKGVSRACQLESFELMDTMFPPASASR
jgi:hypothetical protein